jgi:hypothetical protein
MQPRRNKLMKSIRGGGSEQLSAAEDRPWFRSNVLAINNNRQKIQWVVYLLAIGCATFGQDEAL